jgi:hypothetical protein
VFKLALARASGAVESLHRVSQTAPCPPPVKETRGTTRAPVVVYRPRSENSSRGLALRDHRKGSLSNLTHLFALSPPIVASAIASVSFRLGHAVIEPVLSNAPALMITMRRTDNCFPTPSTTSTRAS